MSMQLNLQKIQQDLQNEHARLSSRVASTLNESEQGKERNPDRTDLSWDYTSKDRKLALLSIEQKTLTQIEAAIQRLELGSYGNCIQCGEAIDPERLEVLPYAALCFYCQASPGANARQLKPL